MTNDILYKDKNDNIIINLYSNDLKLEKVELNKKEDDEHKINDKKIGNLLSIRIGKEFHPSTNIHHIKFILIKTKTNLFVHYIKEGLLPVATFYIEDNNYDIYVYCNVHGLFKKEVLEPVLNEEIEE